LRAAGKMMTDSRSRNQANLNGSGFLARKRFSGESNLRM